MTTATTTSKTCCQCGRDVTGAQRMRDSQGKYWCLACGESDQHKRRLSAGVTCAGCNKSFPQSAVTSVNMLPYCMKCAKKRKQRSGETMFSRLTSAFNGDGQTDRRRMVLMLAVVVILAVVALAINLHL